VIPEQDGTGRRKANPAEFLFPTTVRWMEALPSELQPTTIGKAFPRIANTLAALWTRPDGCMSYLEDLLVDKRGGRRGFSPDAMAELRALARYYAISRPDRSPVPAGSEQPR
jgi:hypothetical protein